VSLIQASLDEKMTSLTSNHKLVISGSNLEHYHYLDSFIPYGYIRIIEKRDHIPTSQLYESEEQREVRILKAKDQSKHRAKRNLHRLVDSNAWQYTDNQLRPFRPVFITFTFKQDIKDIKQANYIFTKFIKRFNYLIYKNKTSRLRYLSVLEFQDEKRKGVIHFHTLFFNLPWVDRNQLTKTWGKGYTKIVTVYKVRSLSRYMSKYMSKGFNDPRLFNKKRYFTSFGLYKPIILREQDQIETVLAGLPAKTTEKKKFFE